MFSHGNSKGKAVDRMTAVEDDQKAVPFSDGNREFDRRGGHLGPGVGLAIGDQL
jgi:hypothetical protein